MMMMMMMVMIVTVIEVMIRGRAVESYVVQLLAKVMKQKKVNIINALLTSRMGRMGRKSLDWC